MFSVIRRMSCFIIGHHWVGGGVICSRCAIAYHEADL